MTSALFPLAISAALVLALVPILARTARRVGLVDDPDKVRSFHATSIPLVGGIAVFVATIVTVATTCLVGRIHVGARDASELFGLLAASTLLVAVGVVDDRYGLRGRQKLLGQVAAVTALVASGYQFSQLVFVVPFHLGSFSFLVVYAWCLAAINAVNLLDGADGFASTVGIVASLAMGFLCLHQQRLMDATICLALAGGLLGFLRYNFPPASVYLGDAGSMLIGLVLSAIAIRSSFKQAALYAVAAPAAMLAIPFIDTAAAVVRRRLTGRSIYHEDRGHMHHLMAGLGPVRRLFLVALLCSITALGGVLAIVWQQSAYAVAATMVALIVMLAGGFFGRVEAVLLVRSAWAILRSFLVFPRSEESQVIESVVQIQGAGVWEDQWLRLAQFAAERGLNQVTLDVNAPWKHEGFHADWRRSGVRTSPSQQWEAEVPLLVSSRILGKVTIRGDRAGRFPHRDVVTSLLELTGDIERSVAEDEAETVSPPRLAGAGVV